MSCDQGATASTSQGTGVNLVPVPGVDGDKWLEDNGNIFVRIGHDNYAWVPFTDTLKTLFFPDIFPPGLVNQESTKKKSDTQSLPQKLAAPRKKCANWFDIQVYNLMELWKKYRKDFEGTSKSSAQVWNLVAAEEGVHTPAQLKEKWKTLKKKFSSEFDKYGDKGTGEEATEKWKFFDDFFELFKDDPKYTPVSIASTRAGLSNLNAYKENQRNSAVGFDEEVLSSSEDEFQSSSTSLSEIQSPSGKTKKSRDDVVQLPPSKKTKVDKYFEHLEKTSLERERGIEERHAEAMEYTGMAVKYLGEISNTLKAWTSLKEKKD